MPLWHQGWKEAKAAADKMRRADELEKSGNKEKADKLRRIAKGQYEGAIGLINASKGVDSSTNAVVKGVAIGTLMWLAPDWTDLAGGFLGKSLKALRKCFRSAKRTPRASVSGRAPVQGAPGGGPAAQTGDRGVIYRVPGSGTPTGKPYIGRNKHGDPHKHRGKDGGRDRSKAETVDTFDRNDTREGRFKEQSAIEAEGGLDATDNVRNEIASKKIPKYERKYGKMKRAKGKRKKK